MALVTAAWSAVRVKGSYLQAQFLRLKVRRGAKKAILAVAASMLTAAYHMLKNDVAYQDLGADHFTRRDRSKAIGMALRPRDFKSLDRSHKPMIVLPMYPISEPYV
jgi:hypothetical protein